VQLTDLRLIFLKSVCERAIFPAALRGFRRVDAPKPDALLGNLNGIAVNDASGAGYGFSRNRSR
jgi:hypothetical protein